MSPLEGKKVVAGRAPKWALEAEKVFRIACRNAIGNPVYVSKNGRVAGLTPPAA